MKVIYYLVHILLKIKIRVEKKNKFSQNLHFTMKIILLCSNNNYLIINKIEKKISFLNNFTGNTERNHLSHDFNFAEFSPSFGKLRFILCYAPDILNRILIFYQPKCNILVPNQYSSCLI